VKSIRNFWAGLSEPARNTIAALLCFSLFLFVYGITSHANARASDEVATFRTSITLVTERHLYIDDLWKFQHITPIGTKGIGDHLYSKYFPGNTLSAALIYILSAKKGDSPYIISNPTYGTYELAPSEYGARIALRLNALLGAIGMVMLFLLLKKHYRWEVAIVTVLLIGLTTDWWNESQMFYSEIGAGAFLITSLYFADNKNPYLSSLFLAMSIQFRPTNIIALPVWSYSIWKTNRKALFSGIFVLGGLAFLALYNFARYYSFFNFGYGNEGFSTPILIGLAGILFSPGHSLFFYSPIIILSITGGELLLKTNRPLALTCLFTAIGYILIAAMWDSWSGGTVWGSRLVVPIIPILGVLVAAIINELFNATSKQLLSTVILLGVIGFSIQILTIMQAPGIAFAEYARSTNTSQLDAIWSLNKNWLALEIKSLTHWNICNMGAYSLRNLFSQCK
jgi:DIE2/ALG10 family